mgnify:CR=1 FL=1
MKISKTFRSAIGWAAEKLSEENRRVALGSPYESFAVCLDKPADGESTIYSFREMLIEKDGDFYLVGKNLLG